MKKPLNITIITLFPNFTQNYLNEFGIIKRALKSKLLKFSSLDLRQFGLGARQIVDDRPFGGGVGMVLRADILYKAITKAKSKSKKAKVILLTPQGKKFNQTLAKKLAKEDNLILVCGRYEGFDERIRKFVDNEISIGDYVLMGGELPALVVSEAVLRLRPGILGKDESSQDESFSGSSLEYPHYTKPETWKVLGKSMRVPKVLRSGHHKQINDWRAAESMKRTAKRRPDLLK